MRNKPTHRAIIPSQKSLLRNGQLLLMKIGDLQLLLLQRERFRQIHPNLLSVYQTFLGHDVTFMIDYKDDWNRLSLVFFLCPLLSIQVSQVIFPSRVVSIVKFTDVFSIIVKSIPSTSTSKSSLSVGPFPISKHEASFRTVDLSLDTISTIIQINFEPIYSRVEYF